MSIIVVLSVQGLYKWAKGEAYIFTLKYYFEKHPKFQLFFVNFSVMGPSKWLIVKKKKKKLEENQREHGGNPQIRKICSHMCPFECRFNHLIGYMQILFPKLIATVLGLNYISM
jgi:hypothetical protein